MSTPPPQRPQNTTRTTPRGMSTNFEDGSLQGILLNKPVISLPRSPLDVLFDEQVDPLSASQDHSHAAWSGLPVDHDARIRPRTLRFETDLHRELKGVKPPVSLSKIFSYARKTKKVYTELHAKRNSASSSRAQLAYLHSVFETRLRFVQDSQVALQSALKDAVDARAGVFNALFQGPRSVEEATSTIRELNNKFERDVSTLAMSVLNYSDWKTELDKAENEIQALEEKLYGYISKIADEAPQDTEDDEDASDNDDASIESVIPPSNAPPEIDAYLDLLGDQRIVAERLAGRRAEQQEIIEQRELLREQDQPVDPNIARISDTEYSREEDGLLGQLEQLGKLLDEARAKCEERGYNVDKWRKHREDDDDDDDDDDDSEQSPRQAAMEVSRASSAMAVTDPTTGTNHSSIQPQVISTTKIELSLPDRATLSTDEWLRRFLDPAAPQPVDGAVRDRLQNWLRELETDDTASEDVVEQEQHKLARPPTSYDNGETSDDVSKTSAVHGSSIGARTPASQEPKQSPLEKVLGFEFGPGQSPSR